MKEENKKPLGLERVKRWLYAKGLEERSSGCVLCGSCYGHGPANPMEDIPGPKTKCPPYEFYRFQRFTPKSRWLMAQRVFHRARSDHTGARRSHLHLHQLSDVSGAVWSS